MYRGIKKMCEGEFGLPFLCTAFDYKAVDMLDSLDVDAIKIGSAEACDMPFIEYALATGRSLLVSTGGLPAEDIRALKWCHGHSLLLMHCVSVYPSAPSDLCLGSMLSIKANSMEGVNDGPPVLEGYSSHYPFSYDAVFAMALGAQVVEKNYSDRYWRGIDKPGAGTDFAVSISALDASFICQLALDWHQMRGDKSTEVLEAERALLKPFRERFYASQKERAVGINIHPTDQKAGEAILAGRDAGREGGERARPQDRAGSDST
jgi:sialic acid synthase SpsE